MSGPDDAGLPPCMPESELEGADASVRYVLRMARNLAISEVRRGKRTQLVPPEAFEENEALEVVDVLEARELRAALEACRERLPARPREAFDARMEHAGELDDRDLAGLAGMVVNTFHKNLSRARTLLVSCLERHGISLAGIAS